MLVRVFRHDVRVWDIKTAKCIFRTTLGHAIISLSFHPHYELIAMTCGNALYLWNYREQPDPIREWEHEGMLHCVHFPPSGDSIIIGAENKEGRSTANNRKTFKLLLYHFKYEVAVVPKRSRREMNTFAMINPIVILARALLYSDGGMDVSRCGEYLCACAELDEDERGDERGNYVSKAAGGQGEAGAPAVAPLMGSRIKSRRSYAIVVSLRDMKGGFKTLQEGRAQGCLVSARLMHHILFNSSFIFPCLVHILPCHEVIF